MKKITLLAYCCLSIIFLAAQNNLQNAYTQFENDPQLKHATSSLYVIDATTGKVVFDKNSQVGLAPASTQKIITTATAFDLLGKDFRYKTELGYYGVINKDTLNGFLFINPSGDPTFGSWRYQGTTDTSIFNEWFQALRKLGVKKISDQIHYDPRGYSQNTIPDGWIWQDIGNYYGAYTDKLNWKENQIDKTLSSGNIEGERVQINDTTKPINELKAAPKGSGDNAYAYMTHDGRELFTGTIPVNEPNFKISVTQWDSKLNFFHDLSGFINSHGIQGKKLYNNGWSNGDIMIFAKKSFIPIATHYSPSLDSIVYWFLKKSINLYGEALVKTLAYQKGGFASTDSGVAIVKKYWQDKGFDIDELNIRDGSGLSPLNRITTHAQVEILKYARTRDWFPYFYDALPEYNGMKMKSGTISDVKAFCGYQKASDGKDYIFSFIVNNFNGRTSELVNKMYKVLDNLK